MAETLVFVPKRKVAGYIGSGGDALANMVKHLGDSLTIPGETPDFLTRERSKIKYLQVTDVFRLPFGTDKFDTLNSSTWIVERGLPFVRVGQIFFSPIVGSTVYVIDQAQNFQKYNLATDTYTALTGPNYHGGNSQSINCYRTLALSPNGTKLACPSNGIEAPSGSFKTSGGQRIEIYNISGDSWSASTTLPVIDGTVPGLARSVVWENEDVLWVWAIKRNGTSSGWTGKCIKYTISTDTFTVFTNTIEPASNYADDDDNWGRGGAAQKNDNTIVYMGGIGTSGTGRDVNDGYVKYTIATDTYTRTENDDAIFAHAYDRDKLWYIESSTGLNNEQMGYIDISDDSENDAQVAVNPRRTAGFSDHFGVEDSLAGVFSRVATAGLMSIDFQGREGTTWAEDSNLRFWDADNFEQEILNKSDVDDSPVNGATTDPISSNWAYDHENDDDVHTATQVNVSELGTATYDDVQDYINFKGDRTLLTGGDITDNGDGTIAVTSGTAWAKATDSDTAVGKFFNFSADNSVSLSDLTTNYIYLDYNDGAPQMVVATSILTHGFKQDHVLVGTAFRDGVISHFHHVDTVGIGRMGRVDMHHREEHAVHRVDGIVTSSVGTRNLSITTGVLYEGISRHTTSPFTTPNSGTADDTEANTLHDADGGFATTDVGKTVHNTTDDTYAEVTAFVDSGQLTLTADIFISGENYDLDSFTYWYTTDSGSTWTEVLGQTAISNSQYNDVTAGLANLTAQRYGVHWVYMEVDGEHFHVLYGQGNYKVNQAEEATPPSIAPNIVTQYCALIAKIIVQDGTDTLTIMFPWTTVFTSSFATDHGSLGGLADDDHLQYIKDSEFTAADEIIVGTGSGTFGQVTLGASEFLAKKAAGVATNVTATEARAILNVADGADVTGSNPPQAHGASVHTNITREVFITAGSMGVQSGTVASRFQYDVIQGGANAAEPITRGNIKVPDDFVSFTKLELIWAASVGSGNMRWSFGSNYSASGEAANIHSDLPGEGVTAIGGSDILNVQEPANPLTLSSLASGDYLGITFFRDGAHADDTINVAPSILGFLFTYVANQ